MGGFRRTRIKRVQEWGILSLVVSFLAVACTGGSSGTPNQSNSSPQAEHVNYLLAYLPDMVSDTYLLAQNLGYFRRCGIDFTYKSAADVSNPLQLLITGTVDYAIIDPFSYILGRLKGLPIMAIAEDVAHTGVTYASLASTGITSPKDLPGHVVGLSPGMDNEMYLNYIMGKNLTPAQIQQVKIVPEGNSIQPLITGVHDVTTGWFTNSDLQALVAKGIKLNFINALDYGIAVPGNLIVTTTNKIQDNPDQVRRVLAAITAGQYASLDPKNSDLAVKLVTDALGASSIAAPQVESAIYTQAMKLKTDPSWTQYGAGWNSAAAYVQTEDFLVQANQMTQSQVVPGDQLYTNQFLQEIFKAGTPFNLDSVCKG